MSGFSEKLRLLQERDKNLRESRHRQTDIETAKAVKGTCLDMCPEIERFFREETNQLSPLEMGSDGRPDSHAMVKEYRRAGADQSEPLPHEMRPGPVLQRTMDYLLCNIIDRITINPGMAGDWFDFLWSRTRAIRKDITQQHLCDRSSVDLMEKCTRFHVYCSGTMIEEDLSIFDPKINDENMRKCIQSLKDFYHDLHLKGEVCPNESEFRGYDILLNLADSDILREVAKLRKQVRESKPVQDAITAHFALISGNYVRFFTLVSRASFLSSCLLHRYFNRVRLQAIRLMRKSFTVPNQTELYPIHDFCRLLGFDDMKQVQSFCIIVGVNFDASFVHLTREKFVETTTSLPNSRSKILVDSKLTTSIGEAVNGSPLPENPYKKFPLHTSFQENGNLKQDALLPPVSPQISDNQSQPFFGKDIKPFAKGFSFLDGMSSFKPPPPTHVEVKKEVTEEQIESLSTSHVQEMIESEVSSCVNQFFNEAYVEERTKQEVISLVSDKVLTIGIQTVLTSVLKSVVEEETAIKRSMQLRALIKKCSEENVEDMIDNVILDVCSEFIEEDFESRLTKVTYLIGGQMFREACQAVLKQVATETYSVGIQARDALVESMVQEKRKRVARKYLDKWLHVYHERKRLQHIKDTFPASSFVSGVTIKCQLITDKPKTKTHQNVNGKRKSTERSHVPNKKAIKEESKTHGVMVRGIATDGVNAVLEKIALHGKTDHQSQVKLLEMKIKEEQEKEELNKGITTCLAKSMALLESHDLN